MFEWVRKEIDRFNAWLISQGELPEKYFRKKGVIELSSLTVISGLIIYFLTNIHADVLLFKKIPEYRKQEAALITLQKRCSVENPTPEDKIVCEAVNKAIAENMLNDKP